jgi:hypothetical protein
MSTRERSKAAGVGAAEEASAAAGGADFGVARLSPSQDSQRRESPAGAPQSQGFRASKAGAAKKADGRFASSTGGGVSAEVG